MHAPFLYFPRSVYPISRGFARGQRRFPVSPAGGKTRSRPPAPGGRGWRRRFPQCSTIPRTAQRPSRMPRRVCRPQARFGDFPSQSAAPTAPPKGEPRGGRLCLAPGVPAYQEQGNTDCRVASLLAMTPQGKIPIPGTRTAEDSGPYGRFSGNHPIPLRQGTRALPYRIFYRHTSCRAGAHVLRRLSTPKCGKAPGRAKALPGVLVSSGQESSSWPVHSW